MNKKALSGIVATVAVIACAIVLGVIVASLITSPIKLKFAPELSCAQIQLQSPFTINSACYDADDQEVEISLARAFNPPNIKEISFTLDGTATSAKIWRCADSCSTCSILNEGETRTYYFDTQYASERIALAVGDCPIASRELSPCPP